MSFEEYGNVLNILLPGLKATTPLTLRLLKLALTLLLLATAAFTCFRMSLMFALCSVMSL